MYIMLSQKYIHLSLTMQMLPTGFSRVAKVMYRIQDGPDIVVFSNLTILQQNI